MSYPRLGLGGAFPSLSRATFPSMARRIGRFFPPQGAANLVPRVVAWTTATDHFGIAYPAGLVGIAYANPSSVFSDSAIQSALETAAFAVPGTLPSGYTPRLARDLFPGAGGCLSQLSGTHKVRTAAGFANLSWFPKMVVGDGGFQFINTGIAGSPASIAAGNNVAFASGAQGWRNIAAEMVFFGSSVDTLTGSASFVISHNANGSAPGGTGDGDTIDATWTVSAASLFYSGANSWFSPRLNQGAILPTLGTPSTYVIRCTANSVATPGFTRDPIAANLYESFRVDIPLPFTCTGFGGDIAPGGVIPGTVPGY